MNARESAFLSLQKYENSGVYSNIELSYAIERGNLEGSEKSLYTALFYGVIERKLTLDYHLAKFSSKPFEKTDAGVKNLLRLSAYQILYADRIPHSAAVNEGVKLCKKYYKGADDGYVKLDPSLCPYNLKQKIFNANEENNIDNCCNGSCCVIFCPGS